LHSTKWSDGKKKKGGKLLSSKNNSIQLQREKRNMDTQFLTPTKQ
jgi:hypothetical protein